MEVLYESVPRKKFVREELLEKFKDKVKNKQPIIIGSAGIGLVAKVEEMAGIDMIMVTNNDYFRMDGHNSSYGYLGYGDGNGLMLKVIRRVFKEARNTPALCGICMGDPYREIDEIMDTLQKMGCCGFINSPTSAAYGAFMEEAFKDTEMGFEADLDVMKKARERNLLAVGYALLPHHAARLTQAGADIVCAHAGITVGGLSGAPEEDSLSLDEACELTQKIYDAAKAENPEVLVLCHGGPFNGAASVQYCFDQTDINGFIGVSAIDRIPIEESIMEVIRRCKVLRLEKI